MVILSLGQSQIFSYLLLMVFLNILKLMFYILFGLFLCSYLNHLMNYYPFLHSFSFFIYLYLKFLEVILFLFFLWVLRLKFAWRDRIVDVSFLDSFIGFIAFQASYRDYLYLCIWIMDLMYQEVLHYFLFLLILLFRYLFLLL